MICTCNARFSYVWYVIFLFFFRNCRRSKALVGIAARRLSGWGLVVWDHGMLWRERCKAIAELHSSSLFVRKSLISELSHHMYIKYSIVFCFIYPPGFVRKSLISESYHTLNKVCFVFESVILLGFDCCFYRRRRVQTGDTPKMVHTYPHLVYIPLMVLATPRACSSAI